jgi:2'-5' RNA ligase
LPSDQIRSFVSMDLDDEKILSKIESIVSSLKALGVDLKPVERENIHLTLKFLGNVSSAKLDEVREALSHVKFDRFQIGIKGAGAFPSMKRMKVIWVGIDEGWTNVQQIYEQSETRLHQIGFARETRPFSPHITIARIRSQRKSVETVAFLDHLSDESFGSFTALHLRLKQSVLSPSGPIYSTLFEVNAQQ